MRAAVFKEVGKPLVIEQRPDPTPGKGQVVLKVGRCGICGTDLHMTDGHHGPTFEPNTVIGHEFAGEVVAVGPGVENVKIGEKIVALPMTGCGQCAACLSGNPKWCVSAAGIGGGFAEYSLASALHSIKLPQTLSMEDGALIEPLAVGMHGVALANMEPGARVLVIGAGPIGIAATFWARQMGAGKIAVTATSKRREAMAMEVGASAFVVPQEDPIAEVNAVLGGPPDVVFECAGVPDMIMRSIMHVRDRGTVVVLGFCSLPDSFVPSAAVWKEITMKFSVIYTVHEFEVVANTLDAGHLEPRHMITQRISLDELPDTLEALRKPNPNCKVIVDPWR